MPDPDLPKHPTTRVTLSRRALVAVAAFGVTQIAIFVLQLTLQEDQRTTGDRALAVAVRQLQEATPAIRDGRRLTDETLEDLPEARRLTRRSLELTQTATPLVQELSDARLGEQSRAAGALARTLLDNDVAGATRAGRDLAVRLLDADVPGLAGDVRAVSGELLRQRRLRRLLVRSNAVLGEARARHLVEKAALAADLAPEQLRVLQRSMQVQEQTLALQQEAVAIGREALAVAKEAERHAESVDRKTGGTFPGAQGGNGG